MFRIQFLFLNILLFFSYVTSLKKINTTLLPNRDVCGLQEEQRIYGGEEVKLGEFPWLVMLQTNPGDVSTFYCGGSLINNRYVLTAAHCVDDFKGVEIIVRLGEHNRETEEDCEGDTPGMEFCSDPPIEIAVEEKIVHEDSDLANHYNADIALLRLKKEVTYTDFIKPVCLPISPELRKKVLSGSKVVAAGWGMTDKTRGQSDVRRKVELPVTPTNDCYKMYLENDIDIGGTQICAGGEKLKSACHGDSGGPLMYKDRTEEYENWVAVGVVSLGVKCGGEGIPIVYTRVTDYLGWITENLKP